MWTVVVQAGGYSKRMGRNKALVLFRGQPLIERVIERVKDLGEELIVVSGNDELDQLQFAGRVVMDLIPGYGPLGGLYTALFYSKNPYVVMVACDMPFISADMLREEKRILVMGDYDVVVPSHQQGFEPLHAVYRRETCLQGVKRAIDLGEKRMSSWFPAVRVFEFCEIEAQTIDGKMLSFWNINTQADLESADRMGE